MTLLNQDWVLARWREDRAKDEPALYSVSDTGCIYLSINGNAGWYRPEVRAGELTGIRSVALPEPMAGESPQDRKAYEYEFALVSPKQRRKIVAALA